MFNLIPLKKTRSIARGLEINNLIQRRFKQHLVYVSLTV